MGSASGRRAARDSARPGVSPPRRGAWRRCLWTAGRASRSPPRPGSTTATSWSPLDQRLAILKPGRAIIGALHAAIGARFGLDIRDPTADTRLLSFVLSVPDWVFTDPATGTDRWLVRAAMTDRLPDQVRLNRRHGLQASDLVHRLRRTPTEVQATLDELGNGPAAAYVDVRYMREVWQNIQHNDTPDALRKAGTVLTRGIMAGLHANTASAAGPATDP